MKYLSPQERETLGIQFIYSGETITNEMRLCFSKLTFSERLENCFRMISMVAEISDIEYDETGNEFLLERKEPNEHTLTNEL